MTRTIRKTAKKALDLSKIKVLASQFKMLKQQTNLLDERLGELKNELSVEVEEWGYEDDKGSLWLDFDEPVDQIKGLKRECRVSQKLDSNQADSILRKKGLTDRCTKMVPVLDTEEIMNCHYDGLLTEDEIDAMWPKSTTYAFKLIEQ